MIVLIALLFVVTLVGFVLALRSVEEPAYRPPAKAPVSSKARCGENPFLTPAERAQARFDADGLPRRLHDGF